VYALHKCLTTGVEACPTRVASPTGRGTPAVVASTATPDDNRVDVSHADSRSLSNRADPGNHATGVATTLALTASADAADAKRQAC
jgi:hypothetical protein